MKIKFAILFLFIINICCCQDNKNYNEQYSFKFKLEQFLAIKDTILKKGKTPGAAIAIIYNNEIVYKECYGYRNLEKKLPVTSQTLFDIASLTKAFTGVISSQLVEEKKLKWNDKVIEFIPEFKLVDIYASQNASIQDLFTHRVGLEEHYYLIYGPQFSRKELLEKIHHLNFEGSFRENFLYNNFMYTIAGIIQERITKTSWEELIKDRIFNPLEMKQTFVDIKGFNNYKNKSTSYQMDGKTIIPDIRLTTNAPAGSTASSTLDDMTKWIRMLANSGSLNNSEFISKNQFDYLTSPLTTRYADIDVFYGIGWNIDHQRNAIYHRASSPGQNASILFQPEKGFAIVILTNQSSLVANLLEIYASNIFLNDQFERIIEHEEYIESQANRNNNISETYHIKDTSVLKKLRGFCGTYTHPAYGNIEIEKNDAHIYSFNYYHFNGTIDHKSKLNFTANVTYFQGTEKLEFKILKNKEENIKGILVDFPYSEGIRFEKHLN